MNSLTPSLTEPQRAALSELFEQNRPVLVEVRFPRMGTSPDWYLCEAMTEFEPLWDRLGSGAEVHLHSVWDLQNVGRALILAR
jgi:hypothetical protein